MAYNVTNPNILVLETLSGGHLGYQEVPVVTPPVNNGNTVSSSASRGQWADAAMAEFFQAVMECRTVAPFRDTAMPPAHDATPSSSLPNAVGEALLRSRL
jgi:hypothetical protein